MATRLVFIFHYRSHKNTGRKCQENSADHSGVFLSFVSNSQREIKCCCSWSETGQQRMYVIVLSLSWNKIDNNGCT